MAVADAKTYSIELAFRRLRLGVLGCCWIVGLALTVQLVVWSLARYTDMRFETRVATAPTAQIVSPQAAPAIIRPHHDNASLTGAQAANEAPPVDPNRVFSKYDEIFRHASALASSLGKLAFAMLMPLLAVGVFLSAGSGAAGVHKSVSAFTWSLVLAILMLPVGALVEWPALTGAFYGYDGMLAGIEASMGVVPEGEAQSAMAPFARYLMLPGVCLIGLILVGFRFSLGVEASLLHQETRQLDPAIEREASNRSATSLAAGAGRSAGALTRVMGSSLPSMPPPAPRINGDAEDRMPSATKVSPGDAPRRLI